MIKSSYEVEVLVNGKPLKEYLHEGKSFIEGRKNTPFSIRIRNNSSQRKLFVPSIDGLSVMDGKEAEFDSSGYIVRPWSTITIDGWRTSEKDVAEFFFTNPENSYGKRTGKGNNLGVIGVAVFGEKQKPPSFDPRDTKYIFDDFLSNPFKNVFQDPFFTDNGRWSMFESGSPRYLGTGSPSSGITNMTCSCSATPGSASGGGASGALESTPANIKAARQELGTGWGDSKRSEVTTVTFERESEPREVFELYYNTREGLEKLGVNLKKETLYATPQAFPGRFCTPPDGE